jgi:serine/threonine protein kinase
MSRAPTYAQCFGVKAPCRLLGRSRSSRRSRLPSTPLTRRGSSIATSPSNVLIDERGHRYLADFGLTQSVSDRGHVTDGSLLGTLDYVAPEQIRGDVVDGRADVYALGCMLFECLTGEVPFSAPSEVATIYAHLEEKPPVASARRPALPTAIDAVFTRAMAKVPSARYASCAELVADARTALGLDAAEPRRRLSCVARRYRVCSHRHRSSGHPRTVT